MERSQSNTADGGQRTRTQFAASARSSLELLIFVYVAVLLAAAIGHLHVGFLSINRVEKPILVLLMAVPLRLTLGGPWLVPQLVRTRHWRLRAPSLHFPPSLRDAAFAVLVTRIAVVVIGFTANVLFARYRVRPFAMPFDHRLLVETFAAWDSGWYFDIARHGYYFSSSHQSSIAFFPLYPMLMRTLAWPFSGTDRAVWIAGIVISWTTFVLGLIALHRLTDRWFGDREIARRTVLYVAVFPFSLFFTSVYAESVFFLTSILAVSDAYEERWWRSGAWAGLATLARPNGVLVAVPLTLIAVIGAADARSAVKRLLPLIVIPFALGGYCWYAYHLSGDPLAWLHAETQWGYSLGHPPWQTLLTMIRRLVYYGPYDYFFTSPVAPFRFFHGAIALIFLALTPAVFKRLGAPMGMYVLISLLVPLSGNALEGIGRYAVVLFPAFMVVGSLNAPRMHEAVLVGASLFLALFVCLFSTGRPIY